MKVYFHIDVTKLAKYAACQTEAERSAYVMPSSSPDWGKSYACVGEIEATLPPLTDAQRVTQAQRLDVIAQTLRAETEAQCTALEGVKQSLLALTYEGSTL